MIIKNCAKRDAEETGRAAPSRDMVLKLAERLDVPLRERNVLLVAAGFAPAFPQRPLEDPALPHDAEYFLRHQRQDGRRCVREINLLLYPLALEGASYVQDRKVKAARKVDEGEIELALADGLRIAHELVDVRLVARLDAR